MGNVVVNPDFSLIDPDTGGVLGWTRDWTFEPKLAIPSVFDIEPNERYSGNQKGIEYQPGLSLGQGRYLIGTEGRMNPAYGFPGLIYTADGFDANPGDVWHLSFRYQYAAPIGGEVENPVRAADFHEVFVRFGVTLWNAATQHWDAFYHDLPIQPIVLPADPAHQDGPIQSYDYAFTVPANFPSSRLQFAVCHTPNYHDNAYYQATLNPGGWEMPVGIADVVLEIVSAGTDGGIGSSPDDSFWHFYPTPRYYPGYPIGSIVELEWDQWEINPIWPSQIVYSTQTLIRPQPMPAPGIFGEIIGEQDPDLFGTDGFFVAFADLSDPPGGNVVANGYTVNMPPTDTLLPVDDPTIIEWRGLFNSPFSTDCGPHVAMLLGLRYLVVGPQIVVVTTLFGPNQHPAAPGGLATFFHPYLRAPNTLGDSWYADPPPDQFDYDPCAPASSGIHIWHLPPHHR